MQRENADYHSRLNRVLSTFHMTKTELLAYIQLGRGEQSDKDITDFFNRLDERTEANLIRAVEQRVDKHSADVFRVNGFRHIC